MREVYYVEVWRHNKIYWVSRMYVSHYYVHGMNRNVKLNIIVVIVALRT